MDIGNIDKGLDFANLRSTARPGSSSFEKLMRESKKEIESRENRNNEMQKYFPGLTKNPDHSSLPGVTSTDLNSRAATPRADIATYVRKTDEQIREEVASSPERKKLYESAQEFQSLLLGQMLGAMRKNLHKENELLNGGRTEEIFEDYLYDEYSKAMSKQPGFNLSDEIYRQLTANLPPATDVKVMLPSGLSSEQLHQRGPGL
ncbi:MAG: rod-binding protein [Spirochaetia bacterium]|nr:rod-binding protein [Spirochaetia bacterium]